MSLKLKGSSNSTANKINDSIEEVKVKVKDNEFIFNVLKIDSPEKWQPAQNTKRLFHWNIGNKTLKVNLSGISYGKWSEIEDSAPIPERPNSDDIQEQDKYQEEFEKQLTRKRILSMESATGMEIPGSIIEEKEEWIKRKSDKELESIFDYIQSNVCCIGNGNLDEEYKQVLLESDLNGVSIDLKSLEDWDDANAVEHTLRFNRPGEDYIVEIPLNGISKDIRKKIESETKDPLPPKILKRDPKSRKFDPSAPPEYNFKDPNWIKRVNDLAKKRMVLLFDTCLTFDIPGNSTEEKYKWISDRLLGDVIKLRDFIRNELIGFSEYRDFF